MRFPASHCAPRKVIRIDNGTRDDFPHAQIMVLIKALSKLYKPYHYARELMLGSEMVLGTRYTVLYDSNYAGHHSTYIPASL